MLLPLLLLDRHKVDNDGQLSMKDIYYNHTNARVIATIKMVEVAVKKTYMCLVSRSVRSPVVSNVKNNTVDSKTAQQQ